MKPRKDKMKTQKFKQGMSLASGESATLTLPKGFIESLPRYGTKKEKGKDGETYLITTNSHNGKFAVAPSEAVKWISKNWKNNDYIPMSDYSPEELCCELLQGYKTKYYAAFVIPKKILFINIGWKVKWIKEEEAKSFYEKLFYA